MLLLILDRLSSKSDLGPHKTPVNISLISLSLSVASFYGKLNIVKILIEHGVNVDKPRIRDGKTALMFACSEGNIEIIKVFFFE